MTPLEEARAFQAEATKGGQKSRGSRGRGRGHGGAPPTTPPAPSTRGGRGGGGRGGSSLLQRAVSNSAFQPAPVTQKTNGRHPDPPSTPSYTPQSRKARPFAIPIVVPPSDYNDFTPAVSPAGIGSSIFIPQAAPNTTAPPTGPKSQTPVGRASTSLEGSRHATPVMTTQRQPTFRGRGRGRGRGGRANRFTTQEEEDEVFSFFNDDTPAPVGEVRFYQEEYVKKDIEPSNTNIKKVDPKAKSDVPDYTTDSNSLPKHIEGLYVSRENSEKADHKANPNTKTTPGSSVKPAASWTLTPAKASAHLMNNNSGPKESFQINGNTTKKTDPKTSFDTKEPHVQNKTEGERVKTKKEAKLAPHDKHSSSVGVFGGNINVDKKTQGKPQEAALKQEAKTVTKASTGNGLEVKAPGKSVPAASKVVNVKELEYATLLPEQKQREQQLRREREEREKQVRREHAERKKQLALERVEQKRQLNREHAEKKKQLARELVEQERQLDLEHAERKKQLLLLHEIEEKAQLPAHLQQDFSTDDTVPDTASNPMDDLMDMDFEPTTTEYVAPPNQPSPSGFNSNQHPPTTGFPEAEEEEEL